MATLLRVPEVAAGATEAILSEWLLEESASFRAGDPVVTLETDKALVEVPAEADGILLRPLATQGETVAVGAPMALLGDESERDSDVARLLAELGVQESSVTSGGTAPSGQPVAAPASARGDGATPASPAADADVPRTIISPLARRMLREAGLSTEDLPRGTGPNGRIVRRDVEEVIGRHRATAGPAVPDAEGTSETAPKAGQAAPVASAESATPPHLLATQAPADRPDHSVVTIPHTRLRRAIATRLTASKRDIPHFYLKRVARLDALLTLRAQLNEVSKQRISVNDLVVRAAALALQEVPEANITWTEEGMLQFATSDVAVAIASKRGLVTPVLRSAEDLSPAAIARHVAAYVSNADDGTLRQSDLEGGSLTVTNLGMYGVDEFSAIINPPQSAILAVGAARPEPIVEEDQVTAATRLPLVLSVDHRAIDGALAARWLDALVSSLEQPLRLVV
ncbi:dihydrolipoamide acetyltransferase family protein [Streptomyces sp. DSM 41524]|uniref:Dihydrolipoamide acetyltransferase component of pyruvate dehydrogenase complex n=1 Tax=Streptomyces asiaticus subsp. ignotus TaxID=3098222 RepID=A0ABU7Q955_9ACTN|nr:dihydrolipoamide acetyltransferase family protein [Streptomyces sp. DSM 41524]